MKTFEIVVLPFIFISKANKYPIFAIKLDALEVFT